MNKLTETQKIYLAGIFDGEGCVGYYKRKGNRNKYSFLTIVMISQSDARLMTWLRNTLGMGTVYSRPGKKNFEYHWETNKKADVIDFLTAIQPYLILKGEQVNLILEHLNNEGPEPFKKGTVTPEIITERIRISEELKALKVVNLLPVH